ncbi:AAA family ATPase [Elioraea tepidiphila]|uniref:AAA family ATPase n=1 Tax=Elioraea tepidiphila TaxID=457934 RepID=UPI00035F41C0|nr:hypothetical protein [Elioraea tepidiphila]
MRLVAVEVEEVRRFAGRWRVGPFAPGLNVLAAENEAGKSTLLAAIQAAIFLPHRNAAETLRPVGGGIPRVRLELADSAGQWVIFKHFAGRTGRAEVITPAGETLTGEEAEQAIRRLFGLAAARGRGETERGVWGALWVEQGHSFDLARLDDPARRTLRSALEAEVGTVTGAAGIARLRAAVAHELAAFQSPGGRETRGRLRTARDRRDELDREITDLGQRRRDVETDLGRLAELRDQRALRLEARTEQAFERKLDEARTKLGELDRAKERREAALHAAQTAAIFAQAAVRERDQRQRDRDESGKAEQEAVRAREAAQEATQEAVAAEEEARRAALRAAATTAVAAARQCRDRVDVLAKVADRLRAAGEAEARARQAQPTATANGAAAALVVLAAVLAAVPGFVPGLAEAWWWGVAAAVVALAGAAFLFARALGRRAAAQRALATTAAERAAAQAAAEALAPGTEIAAALAGAEAEAQQAEARARELGDEAGLAAEAVAPPSDEANAARAAADRAAREAERRSADAEAKAEAARRLADRLGEARAREPDDDLEERVRRLDEDAKRRQDDAAALAVPTAEERAAIKAEIARLEAARNTERAEDQRIADEIARIEGGLARIEAEGLDEHIAAAEGERDRLHRELDQLETRRAALNLLDETLRQAEEAATASWLEPVTRTLAPWLDQLIPGARATLDEATLQPAGLSRSGRDETFAILSRGTQEQIAVLVRLAFAEILRRQGRPVPVILDDALVFSDDDRIERMFDILSAAAERMQIVVLTCRTGLFARLGGHRLALEHVS